MPATSKAQYRYFQGVAHGTIAPPKGMTRAQAAEYVQGQSPKGLPARAAANGRTLQRKRQMRRGK